MSSPTTNARPPPPIPVKPTSLPPNWRSTKDAQGQITRETRWDPPTDITSTLILDQQQLSLLKVPNTMPSLQTDHSIRKRTQSNGRGSKVNLLASTFTQLAQNQSLVRREMDAGSAGYTGYTGSSSRHGSAHQPHSERLGGVVDRQLVCKDGPERMSVAVVDNRRHAVVVPDSGLGSDSPKFSFASESTAPSAVTITPPLDQKTYVLLQNPTFSTTPHVSKSPPAKLPSTVAAEDDSDVPFTRDHRPHSWSVLDQEPKEHAASPSPGKLIHKASMNGFMSDLEKKLSSSSIHTLSNTSEILPKSTPSNLKPPSSMLDVPKPRSGSLIPTLTSLFTQSQPTITAVDPIITADEDVPSSSSGFGFGGFLKSAHHTVSRKKKDKTGSACNAGSDNLDLNSGTPITTNSDLSSSVPPEQATLGRTKTRPASLVISGSGIDLALTGSSNQQLTDSAPSINPTSAPPVPTKSNNALSRLFNKKSPSPADKGSDKSLISPYSIFGGLLTVLGMHQVPDIVPMCIAVIEERGCTCEGIYRLSGNASMIQKHKQAWMQVQQMGGPLPEVGAFDVNVVTGTLKLFLRELQDPVLTCDMYPDWIAAGKLGTGVAQVIAIKALLKQLPATHFALMQVLVWHLHRMAKFADVTKMDVVNLAIVFGPTLVRSRVETMESIVNTEPQNLIVAEMIKHAGTYFEQVVQNTGTTSMGLPISAVDASFHECVKPGVLPMLQIPMLPMLPKMEEWSPILTCSSLETDTS